MRDPASRAVSSPVWSECHSQAPNGGKPKQAPARESLLGVDETVGEVDVYMSTA